jgi:hypothetical protein
MARFIRVFSALARLLAAGSRLLAEVAGLIVDIFVCIAYK